MWGITPRDLFVVGVPLLVGVAGLWWRMEIRINALEVSVADIKKIVLNGHRQARARAARIRRKRV